MTETEEKEFTTNGCAFRSLRKTWESWLTAYYGSDPQMRERILSSQGHKKEVALSHYLEVSFDKEDLKKSKLDCQTILKNSKVVVKLSAH